MKAKLPFSGRAKEISRSGQTQTASSGTGEYSNGLDLLSSRRATANLSRWESD